MAAMRNPGLWLVLLWVLLVAACAPQAPQADLILHNGDLWTADESTPHAQAVAVLKGRILAVGSDAEVMAHRGGSTQVVDLQGAFALPAFNDNHVHFASAARFLEFNIMRTGTQEEFVERVEQVVSSLDPGEWILGGYWGAYDQWAEGSAGGSSRQPFSPDMRIIEEITSQHPVFIRKFDNSQFAANRKALETAGLDPDRPRARGVEFLRDSEGYTGVFQGQGAAGLFRDKIPGEFTRKRRISQTKNAFREIVRHGVSNVSDMSDEIQLDIYRELREQGELDVRIHFRYPLDDWKKLADRGLEIGSGDEWIRLGSLKGHIDGIMGTSTARFFEPYAHNPGSRGRWRRLMVDEDGNFVEGKFLQYMLDADQAGLQLTVHAIGDEANHLLLDYLEELRRQNGEKDRRFRLVHAQVIAPDDFPRLGELEVVAEVQPFHLSDDMRWMEERIGHQRSKGAYAFKTIQDNGGLLCFGTDWPGTSAAEYPINPMLGIYAAVTRQTVTGEPQGGWFPDERISVEEALKAYTYNTAYANFEEQVKGSLTPGKVADIAVLSQDLLEIETSKILDTEVLYTVIGGQIAYQRDETQQAQASQQ
ncbi:MAG TPA: amidohydrolase [Acidobacteriota bacterium]|nr:amidohydrolase [Acidobacteriota bacterium]